MRIVIDMQGAQTESRLRSIGLNTMALAKAVVRNRGEHEIVLALSGLFPETIEPIRAAFYSLLPQENIRIWYAPGPVRECEPGNAWRREVAERIREAFLASLRPDVVHVTSLFEGYADDGVTSISAFAPQLKTVVSLHGQQPQIDLDNVARNSAAYRVFHKRKSEYLQHASAVVQLDSAEVPYEDATHINQDWPGNPLNVIQIYEQVRGSGIQGNHLASGSVPNLLASVAAIRQRGISERDILAVANSIALNNPECRRRNLYVDISDLVQKDLRTGIQRVTRSILCALQSSPPEGYQVIPVYATLASAGYRHASQFAEQTAGGAEAKKVKDDSIDPQPGDVFLGLDFVAGIVAVQRPYLEWMRNHGVRVHFVVYDLLPIEFPHAFPVGAEAGHRRWLQDIAEFDGVVCISQSVQAEFDRWLEQAQPKRLRPFKSGWFHLGADIENSTPSKGMPADAEKVIYQLSMRPTFLMVGTVEPRKGHAQVLDAFEQLWRSGVDINLVVAGKEGWMVDDLIYRLRTHTEINNRLFWLENASDQYLQKLYANSQCLIAASYGEGFGLPLIEAGRIGIPILARDIAVFREIAGSYARYFSANSAQDLANVIQDWLMAYKGKNISVPKGLKYIGWKESANKLINALHMEIN